MSLFDWQLEGNVTMIDFISNSHLLFRLKNNNWNCIDTTGQVHWITPQLMSALTKHPFEKMSTRRLHKTHQVLVMLSYKTYTTTITFNHRGQPVDIYEYESKVHDESQDSEYHVLADRDGQVFRIVKIA